MSVQPAIHFTKIGMPFDAVRQPTFQEKVSVFAKKLFAAFSHCNLPLLISRSFTAGAVFLCAFGAVPLVLKVVAVALSILIVGLTLREILGGYFKPTSVERLVSALGGYEALRQIPIIPTEYICSQHTHYLRVSTDADLTNSAIHRGVDSVGRSLINLQLVNENGEKIRINLFERFQNNSNYWSWSTDTVQYVPECFKHGHMKESAEQVQKLLKGESVGGYKLVSLPNRD